MKFLDDLFKDIPIRPLNGVINRRVQVSGIQFDSRKITMGDIFVACKGGTTDGNLYIHQAISKGACAVVGTEPLVTESLAVPYVQVSDTRKALAYLSAALYGFPARKMVVIGITGTDGKTTTANLIYSILRVAGIKCGIISTINAKIGDKIIDTGFHVTTPEAPDIQKYLSQMVEEGITHVILEATSHGLAQERVTACEFDIGVVTNITHEHLDFHKDYQSYSLAKGRLFQSINESVDKPFTYNRIGILNRDDISFDLLSGLCKIKQIAYSINNFEAEVVGIHPILTNDGLKFTAITPKGETEIISPLYGRYNVSNCLAAICATVCGLDIPIETVQSGIASLKMINGRMERIELGQNFIAIVDFAHTPNALKNALETARQLTEKRVIVVFGSAGLRDKEKRRLMAETAIALADISIFTAEDPRTESLEGILTEMAEEARIHGGEEGTHFYRIPHRGEAILHAVALANRDDVVIACGKGHEKSMCFGDIEYPWDDCTAMNAAVSAHMGIPGPEMPFLPK